MSGKILFHSVKLGHIYLVSYSDLAIFYTIGRNTFCSPCYGTTFGSYLSYIPAYIPHAPRKSSYSLGLPKKSSKNFVVRRLLRVLLGGTERKWEMDVSKMDGEAVVEDERTKLYSKGNNFF